MSRFPIEFKAPCGQPFCITAEHVREDYRYAVRQFDDLTLEQADNRADEASQETLFTWFAEQWEYHELLVYKCKVGSWVHKGKQQFYRGGQRSGSRNVYDWVGRLRGNNWGRLE